MLGIQSATCNPRQPNFCPIRFEFDDVRSIFRQHMFFKIRLERASTLKRKARSGLNLMSVLLLRNVYCIKKYFLNFNRCISLWYESKVLKFFDISSQKVESKQLKLTFLWNFYIRYLFLLFMINFVLNIQYYRFVYYFYEHIPYGYSPK